jgi:hypothetical protein
MRVQAACGGGPLSHPSPCATNPRVYEDGADEIALRVDEPCQLLGVGLCGTHGG